VVRPLALTIAVRTLKGGEVKPSGDPATRAFGCKAPLVSLMPASSIEPAQLRPDGLSCAVSRRAARQDDVERVHLLLDRGLVQMSVGLLDHLRIGVPEHLRDLVR
jgi:hypothetical protein